MARALNKTIVAGGVIYPVGTVATPELGKLISDPDHWSGSESAEPAPHKPDESESAESATKRQSRAKKKAD